MMPLNVSQSLALGLGRDSAATTSKTLTGVGQIDMLLEDPLIRASQPGLVTDILLGGQSVMCSDKGADILMFHPEAVAEGMRGLGIPFHKQQEVVIKATLDANGTIAAGLGMQPLPDAIKAAGFPDVNGLGRRLNYVYGLGSVALGAGATGELIATSRRDVRLGALFLSASANLLDVEIEYVKVNGVPMLAGRSGSTIDYAPAFLFDYLSTDVDGRVLSYDVKVGDIVTIGFINRNAGSITMKGGIFILPDEEPGALAA